MNMVLNFHVCTREYFESMGVHPSNYLFFVLEEEPSIGTDNQPTGGVARKYALYLGDIPVVAGDLNKMLPLLERGKEGIFRVLAFCLSATKPDRPKDEPAEFPTYADLVNSVGTWRARPWAVTQEEKGQQEWWLSMRWYRGTDKQPSEADEWTEPIQVSGLGQKGDTATLRIGNVTTIAYDQQARVVNVGTENDGIFDFYIPQGQHATVSVGTVETVAYGTPASVSNTGTPINAVLDFKLPAGKDAAQPTIEIGEVTSLETTAAPTVTNVGNTINAILKFGIPKGVGVQSSVAKYHQASAPIDNFASVVWQEAMPLPISGHILYVKRTDTYTDGTSRDFYFSIKHGDDGQAANIVRVGVTIDGNVGTPRVEVTEGGTDQAKEIDLAFFNLKGEKGDKGDTGEKGEKGDTGEKGEKGDQGEKGDKGDTGDKGEQGDQGETGPQGEQGIQGEKGDKGDTGDVGRSITATAIFFHQTENELSNEELSALNEDDWLSICPPPVERNLIYQKVVYTYSDETEEVYYFAVKNGWGREPEILELQAKVAVFEKALSPLVFDEHFDYTFE